MRKLPALLSSMTLSLSAAAADKSVLENAADYQTAARALGYAQLCLADCDKDFVPDLKPLFTALKEETLFEPAVFAENLLSGATAYQRDDGTRCFFALTQSADFMLSFDLEAYPYQEQAAALKRRSEFVSLYVLTGHLEESSLDDLSFVQLLTADQDGKPKVYPLGSWDKFSAEAAQCLRIGLESQLEVKIIVPRTEKGFDLSLLECEINLN